MNDYVVLQTERGYFILDPLLIEKPIPNLVFQIGLHVDDLPLLETIQA